MLAPTSPQRPGGKCEDAQEHGQRGCGQKSRVLQAGWDPWTGNRDSQRQEQRCHTQRSHLRVENQLACSSGGVLELLSQIPSSPEATSTSPLAPAEPEFLLQPLQEMPQRSEAQTPSDNFPLHKSFL